MPPTPSATAPGDAIPNVKTDTMTTTAMIAMVATTAAKIFQNSRPLGST